MRARRRVGPYRIESEVQQGKLGTLYRARDTQGNLRALKVFHSFLIQDRPGLEEALQHLVERLQRISHPYVVVPVETGYDPNEDVVYVVSPWIERATPMGAILQQEGGRLSFSQVAECLWRTLLALRVLSQAIGLHGSLKLSNLVRGERGRFYVTDPGLARAVYRTQPGISPWDAIGTSDYLPPELIEGGEAGSATDLYALGAIAYHMLEGRPLFPSDDPARCREAHRTQSPPPLQRSDVPPAFQRWLLQLLSKKPQDRFQDPAAALEALAEILLERGWAMDFWRAEAQALLELRALDLAAEHVERVLQVQPNHPEALMLKREIEEARLQEEIGQRLERARQLLREGQLEAAREAIRWVLQRAPQHPEAAALRDRVEEILAHPPALVLRTRSGRAFRLEGEGIMGRSGQEGQGPEVDLAPEDSGRYVSRRHARLWWEKGAWWIQIFPETVNTTWMDGVPMDRGRPYPLHDGVRLRIGNVELEVAFEYPKWGDA
ncbi:protein kinase domain-containing protein [Thermoflexus sp.]|uniref:protein kinase domain-containing protein n=1 Tax=Thermoflexus sp. TaxID=1969742 RepID=UPI002ADE255C|nr:protein kinase [Thermoflexus sp.]